MVQVKIRACFPTLLYQASLGRHGGRSLNARLLRECLQLSTDDPAGRRWSRRNYPGGYTSYASANRMHRASTTFAALERAIDAHVAAFVRRLRLDLTGHSLEMTDCWVNVMQRGTAHGLHVHPLSTISGTYYVRTPPGSPGLKFEDPRLDRFMAAPPRSTRAPPEERPWLVVPARAGELILFESWLRHEVSPNPVAAERISISFNYSWF